ncbi:MAG TPA: twin transmembrane helix small protein [Steroidobacteraceae bacterium]|nr:twin transmembrane helix small protein [Steroidobacteraceae bacterium]
MSVLIHIAVLVLLLAIVGSLASALYQLSRPRADSGRMLRSLMWRVGLSLALFALLMLAWYLGLIRPHGL